MTKYQTFSRMVYPSRLQDWHNRGFQSVSCIDQTLIFWIHSYLRVWLLHHHARKYSPAKFLKTITLISLWKIPRECSCLNPSTICKKTLQISTSDMNSFFFTFYSILFDKSLLFASYITILHRMIEIPNGFCWFVNESLLVTDYVNMTDWGQDPDLVQSVLFLFRWEVYYFHSL